MFEELTDWFLTPISNLFNWLNEFVQFQTDFLTNLPQIVFNAFATGIVGFFSSLPVPVFINLAVQAWSSIPSEVAFFMGLCQFNFGIKAILSAYLFRFILRRIPFIG